MSELPLSQIPLLDEAQISMLKETAPEDAAELFTELKDLFEEEGEPLLERLGRAIHQQDVTGIERSAHALAGSSSNIGYLKLSKLVRELEHSDLSRPVEVLQTELDELKRVYSESSQAMQVLIDSL